ncbi:MAG: SUF system NifU family Fe-S cluster assembly protein [Armatimonadetes bacterium]|nr:SUF system NifU family Fe-S cluster assembly protein [Armatimonadota bacterium]
MNSELRDLYQDVILSHYRQPKNWGDLPDSNANAEGFNPLCGDRISVFLRVKDGVLEDIRVNGCGCAISCASASMMTEAVKGKSVEEAEVVFEQFHRLVIEGEAQEDDDSELSALAGVHEHPVRIKCATLAWHTLRAALRNEKQVSTE